MANKLSKTGITTSATAEAWHVTQSIDALTGVAYDLTLAGTLNLTGSAVTGSFSGDGSQLTGVDSSSYASTASYAVTASYAENGGGGSSLWYDGGTYLSSSLPINVEGNITASGNISASGTMVALNAYIGQIEIANSSIKSNGGTGVPVQIIDPLSVTGNITASGNISASGDLYGNNLIVATDITASGDISASAGIVLGGVRKTSWPAGGAGLWYDGGTYLSSSKDVQITGSLGISGSIHIVADSHTEFTISGSRSDATFNLTNENSAGAIVISTAGSGDIFFGTNGTPGEYRMRQGGHFWLTGDVSSSAFIYAKDFHAPIGINDGYSIGGGKPVLSITDGGALNLGASHPSNQAAGVNIYVTGSDGSKGLFLDSSGNVTASGNISASGKFIGRIDAPDTNSPNNHQIIFSIGDQIDPNHLLPFTSNGLNFNPGTETLTVGVGGINTTGDITASGDLRANNLYLDDASRVDIKFTTTGNEEHYIRKDGDFLRFRGDDDTEILLELRNNVNGENNTSFPSDGNHGIGLQVPEAKLHVKGNIWASGSSGHITASGDISASGDVYGVTGSFSHIVGASPLIIEADNWSVNESGNLTFMRHKFPAGNEEAPVTVDLGSEDNLPWLLMRSVISVDLTNDSEEPNSIIFQLPSIELESVVGASIDFVVPHDSTGNAGLFFKKYDDDDPVVIVTRIACSDGVSSHVDGSGVGIEAGSVKGGDQFTLKCDGVHWYVNGMIKEDTGKVISIP